MFRSTKTEVTEKNSEKEDEKLRENLMKEMKGKEKVISWKDLKKELQPDLPLPFPTFAQIIALKKDEI